MGLKTTKEMKIKHMNIKCDSLLIVNQVNGSYEEKDMKMITYLSIVKDLQSYFESFNIEQISREINTEADALAWLGAITDVSSSLMDMK